MLTPQMRFRVWIRGTPGTCVPQEMTISRPTVAAALRAAAAWLAAVRRATVRGDRYTRWAVHEIDDKGRDLRLLATGDINA